MDLKVPQVPDQATNLQHRHNAPFCRSSTNSVFAVLSVLSGYISGKLIRLMTIDERVEYLDLMRRLAECQRQQEE
jgi:hypothetical protein